MEKSDIYVFCWIAFLYGWMFLGKILVPPKYELHFGAVGFLLFIGGVVFVDQFLKWQAAGYAHLLAIIRPHNIRYDLFVKRRDSVEVAPNFYATKLELAVPIKHPFYDKISQLVILHRREWEDRIRYSHGKANFKGFLVEHPNSAIITLYETSNFDLDHLNPVPVFSLKEAPGDYYSTLHPSSLLETEELAPVIKEAVKSE